jgi:hypothetical protein
MTESRPADFELSDEQWREISTAIGLPDAARLHVQSAINEFRTFEDSDRAYQPRTITKALKRIETKAGELLDAINDLDGEAVRTMIRNDRAEIGTAHRGNNPLKMEARLWELATAGKQLSTWAIAASKRVSRKATRDSGNLHWLVQRLDSILSAHNRRRVSRSVKRDKDEPRRFVETIVTLACPGVGRGSIAEAIKSATKKRAATAPPRGETSDANLAQSRPR